MQKSRPGSPDTVHAPDEAETAALHLSEAETAEGEQYRNGRPRSVSFEVELKARVPDIDELGKSILRLLPIDNAATYLKRDIYFSSPEEPELTQFRLRNMEGGHLVTRKRKRIEEGIEINEEIEFFVSDPEQFIRFSLDSGFIVALRKVKQGTAYHCGRLTLEVSHVEDLGGFVELEILLENPGSEEIGIAKEELLATLDTLGIDRAAIEPRYYTELLREARKQT